jgi:Fe-S cluster biogenesis protein NfuA
MSRCLWYLCGFGRQLPLRTAYHTYTGTGSRFFLTSYLTHAVLIAFSCNVRLERGLKEKIPEIQEVVQSMPEGPPLVEEQVNIVLDGVRPFLQVVGGTIDVDRIEGVDSIQPTIWLHMQGNSASLNSVKLEIAQRLQRHFMMSGLQIQWKE